MKALSLWQPWATLVACGAKQIETRSWATKYRGPLAIHAAKTKQRKDLCFIEPYALLLKRHKMSVLLMPYGKVIAVCELVNVVLTDPEVTEQLAMTERILGDYSLGRFMWYLESIRMLKEPVAATGRQRLWEWDEMS